jgi:hypothetical protein
MGKGFDLQESFSFGLIFEAEQSAQGKAEQKGKGPAGMNSQLSRGAKSHILDQEVTEHVEFGM